jgi:hypothetical protein
MGSGPRHGDYGWRYSWLVYNIPQLRWTQPAEHAAKTAGRCEPAHRAAAGEALRLRSDIEEESMTDLAARFVYSPLVSTSVKVVCLFCVLGLALSAVIVPLIAPEHLTWVLSHIE